MLYFLENYGFFNSWLLFSGVIFLRYAIFAGVLFVLFYYLFKRKFQTRKIDRKRLLFGQIRHEMGHSLLSALIFGVFGVLLAIAWRNGHTKMYLTITDYSYAYLAFSFAFLVIVHDTYFYWLHRLIHHPRLFTIFHRVHHRFGNPTPWAALAFHPLEAIVEILIVPIIAFLIPLHPIALFAFATWSLLWNVVGHLGYECFPTGWTEHPIGRWLNTTTHHHQHHQRANCNYSLYFNWWDRWMGTNAVDYEAQFQQMTNQ
ncbi:MAG: sterol desaturase family protein [Saprospiraceae bacterium]